MSTLNDINPELRLYVEKEIIPRYEQFDKGHSTDHVNYVIMKP